MQIKMKRSSTKTFILEFETGLTKKDRDLCEKKLRVGRQIYNAFLGEALKRYKAYHADEEQKAVSKEYGEVKKQVESIDAKIKKLNDKKKDTSLSKEEKAELIALKEERTPYGEKLKELSGTFEKLKKRHNYGGAYYLNPMRIDQSNHFQGALNSQVVQSLSHRAIKTIEKYDENMKIYKEELKKFLEGKTKEKPEPPKVNFVKKNETFSIEGCTNEQGITYRNGEIYLDLRKKVHIAIKPVRKNDEAYYRKALENRVKYCRLLSREIRGKIRYYVQVVLEGVPPINHNYGEDNIDILDVKVSHLLLQKEDQKKEIELAPNCKNPEEKIADLDRKMDASRRATNPENYNEDGTCKEGTLKWNYSKNYEKLKARRKELYRSMAERRKISHEILANDIIEQGSNINIKHLSYKALQKRATGVRINENTKQPESNARQGKNIGNRAPSEFIDILSRKLSYVNKEVKILDN